MNASQTSSWMNIRWTLMQTWPLYANAPTSVRFTAQSMSADLSTMTPAFPPSSSTTFFLPARSFIRQPTDGLPVNESSLNRSSLTIRSPSSRLIGRIETMPSGTPTLSMISATASITSGSLDGGLSTIGLPEAIAGATLCAARLSGKLNGEMPAIGPIGKRRVMPTRSLELGMRSSGMTSP